MSDNTITVPKLTRGKCYHLPISEIYREPTDVFEDVFDHLTPPIKKNVRKNNSPKEEYYYDVDETPLPEDDGVLRLKLPIARILRREMLEYGESYKKCPDVNLPLHPGVSVHMGYQPITEETAFKNPVSIYSLSASNFTIARGHMSIDRIIYLIRKVVFSTDDINEITPKNKNSFPLDMFRGLYSSTLAYITFDEYENHRFAKMHIKVCPIRNEYECNRIPIGIAEEQNRQESIGVSVLHIQGDTRLSMAFFQTVCDYVLSNGNTDHKVTLPNFQEGFSDQYSDFMADPSRFEFFEE